MFHAHGEWSLRLLQSLHLLLLHLSYLPVTRMQSDKHNNMFNVAANLKHEETHENINWRLVSAVEWTTAELVCFAGVSSWLLVLSSSVAQFLAYMIDHTLAQVCALVVSSSFPCLLRTLSDSLRLFHLPHFPSLHSLYLPALPAAYSPSSSLMSLTTTRRTAAEELGPPDNENSSTGYEPNDHFITRGLCRVQPGVRDRAAVPWRLRLRWHHHRSDAP